MFENVFKVLANVFTDVLKVFAQCVNMSLVCLSMCLGMCLQCVGCVENLATVFRMSFSEMLKGSPRFPAKKQRACSPEASERNIHAATPKPFPTPLQEGRT